MTGPTPEHGELGLQIGGLLRALAERVGLRTAAPVNIGRDKVDCRVPDIAIYKPDTPRTSPAFLSTAELVVEILSPDEQASEKLDFYRTWGVVDCMGLVAAAHTEALGEGSISYRDLRLPGFEDFDEPAEASAGGDNNDDDDDDVAVG